MAQKHRHRGNAAAAGAGGAFWFAGWLFTISFANLVWWKIILDWSCGRSSWDLS